MGTEAISSQAVHDPTDAATPQPATELPTAFILEQTGEKQFTLWFDHPSWGRSRLITDESDDYRSWITVVDEGGVVRYSETAEVYLLRPAGTSEPGDWLSHPPVSSPIDAVGNIFIDWNPGRYNGVTVLRPTPGGFEDFGTSPMGQDNDFYYAYVVDVDNDGIFEIEKYTLDCNPSCADGTTTSEIYRWTGSGFAP